MLKVIHLAACLLLFLNTVNAVVNNLYDDGENLDVVIKLCGSKPKKWCKDVFVSQKNYTYTGKLFNHPFLPIIINF